MGKDKNVLQKFLPKLGVAVQRASHEVSEAWEGLSNTSFQKFVVKSIRGDYAKEELEQMRRDSYSKR